MTNLDSILKSRDITLPTKICLIKAMVFPVVMYGCESWTIKKAEHWRTDALELVLKSLENPLDCKEIQQVHPKGNQSFIGRCSLEGLMLRLKLLYFSHLMQRVDSLEKTLMLGGIGAGGEGDDRGWDGWMASPTRWTWVWVNSRNWWWEAWRAAIHGVAKSRTQLSEWTELNWGMWNLNSTVKNLTCTPYVERCSLNHWVTREIPGY